MSESTMLRPAAAPVPFDRTFFHDQMPLSASSAAVVAPLVVSLLSPTRLVDVGCGVGTWLVAFKQCGVPVVHGFDGAYVRDSGLLVNHDEFTAADLTRPLEHAGRYDLAVSLEVGEHLPERAADGLVRGLVELAPLVLFSAAFPGQGGTHHVNEQWPSYWRSRFAQHDYVVLDPVRPLIWEDQRVAWWYRCNTYLYAHRDVVAANPVLDDLARRYAANPLTLMHKQVLRRLAVSGRLAKYRERLAMRLLG
jgi:SAM-dependent methyltransferase